MFKKTLAFLMIFVLALSFGAVSFANGEASGESSGEASAEPVSAMIVIDGCAIAHDLSAVPVDEIGDDGEFLWDVTDGSGITYTDADGVVWGIYRAGQAGVFEIVVSSEDDPSPWTVAEQIWVGGSKIVELCVADGKLTHVLTDELQAGASFDVEIREVAEDPLAPPAFPEDATIVSATTYSMYTKNPNSLQDAVIRATLYWDLTNDEVYAIRFLQPMLPWDDNGVSMGWACVTDEALLAALAEADALVEIAEGVMYAKYLEIGGIVWTGEVGSHPAAAVAMDYCAKIGGVETTLNEYVASQEGGEWYVNASMEPVYFLTAMDGDVAMEYQITYKENNGHGVYFWMSDITFPGNMDAIKAFVTENGFDYDFYADGGITKNEDGYWQTVDAVTGATLDETPTYLDVLKTLYNEIQAGNYEVVSEGASMSVTAAPSGSGEIVG